jgi:hypothetical protein
MSSLTNKKELRFVITLGKSNGNFRGGNNNQVTLEGFRATVNVDKGGGQQMGTLRAQIYGVAQVDINSITTLLWHPEQQIQNQIQVYAIDGAQQTLVFSGWIVNAWGNYQQMPDVFLEIQANSAFQGMLTPTAPLSFASQIDVATVINQIATSLGYTFENNGVNVKLPNAYLANTGIEQIRKLADAAGIWWTLDNTTLAIMPPNTGRAGLIPQISSASGLRGYPTFDGVGVNFETLFNPAIKFLGSIQLVTTVFRASGQWIVTGVAHRLESEKPGGAWFSTIRGNANGLVPTN